MGSVIDADEKYFHFKNPYWTEAVNHPNYDAYWQARNILPHLQDIRPAVLVVGGWNDAEDLSGTLKTFRAIEKQSPGTTVHLVMGPWWHGGWAKDRVIVWAIFHSMETRANSFGTRSNCRSFSII